MNPLSLEPYNGGDGSKQSVEIVTRKWRKVLGYLMLVLLTFVFLSLERMAWKPSDYTILKGNQNKTSASKSHTPPLSKHARDTWNSFWVDHINASSLKQNQATPKETLKRIASLKASIAPDISDLFEVFPKPMELNSIMIYNPESYEQLLATFLSTNKREATIVVNGGSSSAGAGDVRLEDRYFSRMSYYLNSALDGKIFNVIDRSHGNRDSLHAAIFATNFLPQDMDLLLWEFAINDGWKLGNQPDTNHTQQYQSSLLAWLEQVKQIKPFPPKVILVYLWPAFRMQFGQNITNPVFEAHRNIAKEFDFVVGHVNLISYIHELQLPTWEDSQVLYSPDWIHINHAGHLVVNFLLLNLLRGKGKLRQKNLSPSKKSRPRHHSYKWPCGTETQDKIFLQDLVTTKQGFGWNPPLATWTLEVPQNESPKQLVSLTPFEIEILGKQNPIRQDRQGSVVLPCCGSDQSLQSSAALTFSVADHINPLSNTQAIFLGIGRLHEFDNLGVYINFKKVHGRLIQVPKKSGEWNCKWDFDFYFSHWFVFSSVQDQVSSIGMCVESTQCQVKNTSGVMLVSMAIY